MKKKKWVVKEKISEDIVSQLLYNRGLRGKNAVADFFNSPAPEVVVAQYPNYLKRIDPDEVEKAVSLIKKAIDSGRPIVIHGDYDVDGICGAAILCQTLESFGAKVTPFIPDRFDEGYGLSTASIDKIRQVTISPLLITTDCGIGAIDEVKYAKSLGFQVIITDHHAQRDTSPAQREHHAQGENLPEADAIVWTDELAGAGVAYLLASRLANEFTVHNSQFTANLGLVALATIADVQPLTRVNRALVKQGLEELNPTRRVGLRELIKVAGLEGKEINTYEVGWMLGPRLNASGRLGKASDSLKLLLTDDPTEGQEIAAKLNRLNQERQQLTLKAVEEARKEIAPLRQGFGGQVGNIIILDRTTWHEGIIGLVAGRIKKEFYRPAVIISKGEKISKGSARSIEGFNIVEALRHCSEFLLNTGGHPMAAGLTIETEKIPQFKEKLAAVANERLTEEVLRPTLKIDLEAPLADLNWSLLKDLKKFEPFGVGNPRPTFLTKSVRILDIRSVGGNGQHLKFRIRDVDDTTGQPCNHFPVIGFGFGEWAAELGRGDLVDIVYNFEENHWNGRQTLQLKLKDLRKSNK